MAKKSEALKNHAGAILRELRKHYPEAHCALDHSNALELLVATILSAQCTDQRVNIVTKKLFKRFKTARQYAESDNSELESLIQSTGFFRAKAKSLQGMAKILVEKHRGEVPQSMDELTELPGVGRKTANVVLGNAFKIPSGIVVDTHVKRLSFRLGLTRAVDPEKVELDLLPLVPEKDWIQFSHWLIEHGRKICIARKPHCSRCFLEDVCPKKGVTVAD